VSAYLRKRRKFQASTEDSLSYINTAAKTAWANDVDLDDLGSYIAGTTAYTGDSSLPDTRGSKINVADRQFGQDASRGGSSHSQHCDQCEATANLFCELHIDDI
jgi:hypothetical protein